MAIKLMQKNNVVDLSAPTSGTSDYNKLNNKPCINGNELKGNLTTEDLGIEAGGLNDVTVNDTSIVTDGVANIPVAQNNDNIYGLVKINSYMGVGLKNGYLTFNGAGDWYIDNRNTSMMCAITPANLDYAVKSALCDGKGKAWTSEEKASARDRMGLEWTLLGDVTVEEDGVTAIVIDIDRTKNYKEFQFYINVAERKTPTTATLILGFDGVTSTSYNITYVPVGTNSTYVLRGYVMRNCNNGWLSYVLGSNNGMPCNSNCGKGVGDYKASMVDMSNPRNMRLSLQTGLDIGSQFIVYAR